jgi:multiple sugar transport system permease protein
LYPFEQRSERKLSAQNSKKTEGRSMSKSRTHEKSGAIESLQFKWGLVFCAPVIIGLLVFILGPMIFSLVMSFTEWNIITPPKFIGLENFSNAFKDPLVSVSLKVTLHYTVLTVPLCTIVTFLLAMLLNSGVRGISVYRTIFYIPSIVPAVASAALWMFILEPQYGIVNSILRFMGLPRQYFLGTREWIIPTFAMMAVWGSGNTVVIYLAGLQGISRELYEAADLDGAGSFRRFLHVTVPLMTPIIFFNMIMGVIGAMQIFTQSYVMTGGGPNNASLFYSLLIYRTAFRFQQMGYASAMSWIFFVIIAVMTFIVFHTSNRWVFYENKAD